MSPTICCADDEPELLALLVDALSDAGFRVAPFPDGAKLLEGVAREKPDLVLLDINMPGLTGWEVRRKLADDPATAAIPVVAVTAQGGASIEQSATRTMEFAGFVRKPFRIAELLATVEDALAKKAP